MSVIGVLVVAVLMQTATIPIRNLPIEDFSSNRPSTAPTSLGGEEYRVGRDDLIEWTVFEVPELNSTARVSATGFVTLPLAGSILVSGLTLQEVETAMQASFKKNGIRDPRVTVLIREYASQPVSVVGAVKLPAIYQIKGRKSLLDVLAMAGGLEPNAGQSIQVIRRPKELQESDPSTPPQAGETITIDVQDLLERGKSELNIPIRAGDTVNVLQAGSVFVVGEVMRPGEFVLRNGKAITVSQAISLGGGYTKEVKKSGALIIRSHVDGTREEIPINIEKLFDRTGGDLTMQPNDILFIPANQVKGSLKRALDSAIAVASGRLIYGVR